MGSPYRSGGGKVPPPYQMYLSPNALPSQSTGKYIFVGGGSRSPHHVRRSPTVGGGSGWKMIL